ncbi:bifunctional diaminohydroxyphosphoribosylaminopyrimidine deaminase/5-amino-6-(5-phosphoribosylamino)uracil reductase RibD [uncultured Tateyamaria sp.]|uniref:bifunctional diaminohydroxyphosphoribosylaminopyrimidine deaminase/5-amino-6-(5-phosphoribosylamino)uracil reductase RibD n=1 Tax=uncultured Tateyamaria sp. TaxID=455651 RepID=UPI0026137BCF|nr:bifunctional diaminohydroxyphosphoribosylaminopyrimidine deaminase/5-amino-6-(5-phosphoribosylamino)uracil reductase RibD [uncultured Tateyamaria sp.]
MGESLFFDKAAQLACEGQGRTGSNPSVGCVIVKDGKIIGVGRTADGGRPHAEANALRQAGRSAKGATVYVTLEPCSHAGRGPACAQSLVDAQVSRVVIGLTDPDTRTNGAGMSLLRAQGIEVVTGAFPAGCSAAMAGYLSRQILRRPLVTLKLAMTLDGMIATEGGQSQWITNACARGYVHDLRAACDGVMVGATTARADNARLTARGRPGAVQPTRIVLTSDAVFSEDSAMIETLSEAPLVFLHSKAADDRVISRWEALGVTCLAVPDADGKLDLANSLSRLGDLGLNRVLCEGGAALATSLIAGDLVDEIITIHAGKLFGSAGQSAINPLGMPEIQDAPQFDLVDCGKLDDNIFARWEIDRIGANLVRFS